MLKGSSCARVKQPIALNPNRLALMTKEQVKREISRSPASVRKVPLAPYPNSARLITIYAK